MMDMYEVKKYLMEHIGESVKVSDLVRHLHFSTAQVYRDFMRQAASFFPRFEILTIRRSFTYTTIWASAFTQAMRTRLRRDTTIAKPFLIGFFQGMTMFYGPFPALKT